MKTGVLAPVRCILLFEGQKTLLLMALITGLMKCVQNFTYDQQKWATVIYKIKLDACNDKAPERTIIISGAEKSWFVLRAINVAPPDRYPRTCPAAVKTEDPM